METRQEAAQLEWTARRALADFRHNSRDHSKWIGGVLVYDSPELKEQEELLKAEHLKIRAEGIAKFAKPEMADCAYCAEVSVYGGPGHHASSNCRSGRHPHCTCDTCY